MKIHQKIKSVFLDLLSFGSPQARLFNLSVILLSLFLIPTKYLSGSPFGCIFKNYLLPLVYQGNCPTTGLFAHCECPACGMTKGLSHFLHGNLYYAWSLNKLVFLVFGVMIIVIVINLIITIKYYKKHGSWYKIKK